MSRLLIPLSLVALLAAGAALPGELSAAERADALVRQLASDSFRRREAALDGLVEMGDAALPALEKAAGRSDPEVRWRAEAAARLIRWRVTRELRQKIGDALVGFDRKGWAERERAVTDLAAVGGKSALPTLVQILARDPSRVVKRAAAIGLLRLGPEGLLAIQQHGGKLIRLPVDSASLRIQIGNGFLEEGQYERALKEYRRALRIEPKNEVAWYNVACTYARMKKIELAIEALETAVASGYDDVEWMKRDADLDNIRAHPGYRALVERMEAAAGPAEKPED